MKGYYAVDGGVLYEVATNSDIGDMFREAMKSGEVVAFTHELALTEVLYLLCRRIGFDKAKNHVDNLIFSGLMDLEPAAELMETAARMKCFRPIALADCYTLALAEKHHLVALFLDREAELVREMGRDPFDVELEFLADKRNPSTGRRL
ncbi:MAG: PIN domain-containing protein [Candidatus Bathyarchaeota archaeon]|nr:PIN domain-containing protein [Candidatus Bathyarchaeota archaeon]